MGILYKETPARAVWMGKELARERKHSVPLHSWPWKATRRGGLGADRALVLFLNFPCLSLVSAKGISMDPFPLGKTCLLSSSSTALNAHVLSNAPSFPPMLLRMWVRTTDVQRRLYVMAQDLVSHLDNCISSLSTGRVLLLSNPRLWQGCIPKKQRGPGHLGFRM